MLLALTTPGVVSAYAVPTHRGISEVTIEAYERIHGDLFTDAEAARVVRGADEEDADPRYANHFYDPINGRGLSRWYRAPIGTLTYPSKQWAQDTIAQAEFVCAVKARKSRDLGCVGEYGHGYDDTRFSSPADYSWDRAVYEYVWGDKQRGIESLGHVLHLIQDATVPAHVRNDDHTSGDTYEDYSARFTQENISVPASIKPPKFTNIDDAFERVASYSNISFISDDTAFIEFPRPRLSELTISGGYAYGVNGLKIARVKIERDNFGNELSREVSVKDPSNLIVKNYWLHLSQKAIEAGVGVIDLFFRAVEEEKETERLKAMNISQKEKDRKETILKTFNVAKLLYGSSLTQQDIDELLDDASGQAAAASLATGAREPQQDLTPVQEPESESEPQPKEEIIKVMADSEEMPVQVSSMMSTSSAATTTSPSVQQLVPVTPGFGGGGGNGGASDPEPEIPAPVVEPVSLAVASPISGSFFATTTITFTGSTEANGLVSLESSTSTATTTADTSGNWSVDMVLDEGSPTISIRATDSEGERATSTSVSIFVDVTPPSLPTVSLPQCADSLAASFCLLATTSVSVDWTDVSDAAYYALAVDGVTGATTTATSSIAIVGYGATSSISVIAYDAAGNAATSTSQSLYAVARPIIINEIAWAGTDASATDEWIELKNNSPFALDLAKVSIGIDAATSSLSGTLDSNTYYLIEDRAGATNKAQHLVLDMDLPDAGAKVALLDMEGNYLDATPDVSACGGWCVGAAAATIGHSEQFGDLTATLSMERIDTTVDGASSSNWRSNDTYIRISASKAMDSASQTVLGTPGMQNSAGLPTAGWDCGSGTLSASGGNYNPTSSSCTYLSAFISTDATRYGDIYKGTVGSSTLASGHSLGKTVQSDQNDAGILGGASAGDAYFVAIMEIRNFGSDLAVFRNYFQTGAGSPPHSNYVTIPWTYSP